MSDDRVNIKCNETTRDRLQALKRDGENWDRTLMRMAEAVEEEARKGGQNGIPVCVACGDLATTWTLVDGAVHCEDCAEVEFPD